MKGPDSCKIGNVRSTRKIDDIFLDDPSLSSIGNASAASMTTQDEELEDSQGFSFEGLLGTWGSFTSWSQCSPDEKPQAPNRLTHQLWTQKIEAFRAMVEEHQTGFREFIERQRMRKLRTGRGKTGGAVKPRNSTAEVAGMQRTVAVSLISVLAWSWHSFFVQ